MHTLVIMDKSLYRDSREKLLVEAADKYRKTCYISFDDPYHVVVDIMEGANLGHEKFIIIDASGNTKKSAAISSSTYVLPAADLFEVHLLLKNIIKKESIEMLFLDSLSALIYKYGGMPLKETLMSLLMEVGTLQCSSSLVVFKEHQNHEVVSHLSPLISSRLFI